MSVRTAFPLAVYIPTNGVYGSDTTYGSHDATIHLVFMI